MNRDTEAIEIFLAWLSQDPNLSVSTPSGESCSQETASGESEVDDSHLDELDPLDSEEVSSASNSFRESGLFSFQEKQSQSFELGDIPAVQDRFYTLIKRRLHTEIERNPPLFPWESEIYDYESEHSDLRSPALVPAQPWVVQLQHLNLPVPMPEALLSQLLDRCQSVMQSSLREGKKLVQAVEFLFPGQSQALNQLAGMVLASPSRSGALTSPRLAGANGFPSHYDVATQAQQMALSLLAAREILNSLTLSVSPDQPTTARQWALAAGSLHLEAAYQSSSQKLRLQAQLPCGGSLQVQGPVVQSTTQRVTAGTLCVELFDMAPEQTCQVEIRFNEFNQPLIFAVQVSAKSE